MRPLNRLELFITLLALGGDVLLLLLFFGRRQDERLVQSKAAQDAATWASAFDDLTRRLDNLEKIVAESISKTTLT